MSSDYCHSSTNASSSQNRSDTSAEFLPYPYTTKTAAPSSAKLIELPQHMAKDLTAEELNIVNQIDTLAFDQAGCRMTQRKLEENFATQGNNDEFSACLLYVLIDILPDVMTNQFGNYLCQKLIEVLSVESLKKLVHAILPSVVEVSMDLHGTRAIQTLVEVLGNEPGALK